MDPVLKMRVHICPLEFSLFLSGTFKDDHARLSKWTKNYDIFNNDALIVPVISNSHWFAMATLGM